MTGWIADFFRLAWGLLYWNYRKSWFRLRRGRARCPCQSPSDSGRALETVCEASLSWHKHANFRRVCPLLVDTPGLRAVTLWVADEGLRRAFADIEAWARECKFHDCAHDKEPGCAVQQAVSRGEIDAARVVHYRDLDAELERVAVQERDRERDARAGRHPRRKSS